MELNPPVERRERKGGQGNPSRTKKEERSKKRKEKRRGKGKEVKQDEYI
jgi:hypothetical protein